MPVVDEIGKWLARFATVLPELKKLWEAVDAGDENAELEAQLALTRKIKDRQAREEIEG